MESEDVQITLELGHKAKYRKNPTPEGFTHDWAVFVRGANDNNIQYFIEKVVFRLHESFQKSKRVVREPPYCVRESGYGAFEIPVEIHFKNSEEPKMVKFMYDLFLQMEGHPPINHVRTEKITFRNPTEDFRRRLLKGGGVVIRPQSEHNSDYDEDSDSASDSEQNTSPQSSPVHSSSATVQVHSHKPLPLPSSKNPAIRTVPMAAVKPLPQQTQSETENIDIDMESQQLVEQLSAPDKIDEIKANQSSSSSKDSSSKSDNKASSKRTAESGESKRKKHKSDKTLKEKERKREHSSSKDKHKSVSKRQKTDSPKTNTNSVPVSAQTDVNPEHNSWQRDSNISFKKNVSNSPGANIMNIKKSQKSSLSKLDIRQKGSPSTSHDTTKIVEGSTEEYSWNKDSNLSIKRNSSNSPGTNIKPQTSSLPKPHKKQKGSPNISSDTTKIVDVKNASSPKFDNIKYTNKKDTCYKKLAKCTSRKAPVVKESSAIADKSKDSKSGPKVHKVVSDSSDEESIASDTNKKSAVKLKEGKHERKEKKTMDKQAHSQSPKKKKTKVEEKPVKSDSVASVKSDSVITIKSDSVITISSESGKESTPSHSKHDIYNTTNEVSKKERTTPERDRKAPNGVFLRDLIDLQRRLETLKDNTILKRVVNLIFETGKYDVGGKTFDFDLCKIDRDTLVKLKLYLDM